jgi:hypothetical protein
MVKVAAAIELLMKPGATAMVLTVCDPFPVIVICLVFRLLPVALG